MKSASATAKAGFDDMESSSGRASGKLKEMASSLGSGISKAAKVASAALVATSVAASVAIGGMVAKSLEAYASYEQLVGGVETLFRESAPIVEGYADNAYKTAGMSANAYMETVTSFSASLLQGLGGDTAAAAEYANMAVTDMSDNANKMGTSISSIQDAYQGFAKQNYTMLDNLKLGYGGTQAEMARLINDSGVLGDTMTVTAENVNQVSFDKIIEAINTVQTEMGITGTTAREAATTIEGSVNSAKAAWTNWLTGLANDNADMQKLTEQLVESVVTAAGNILPRIAQIMTALGSAMAERLPMIISNLTMIVQDNGPPMLAAAASLFSMILRALVENGPFVLASLLELCSGIVQYVADNAPMLLSAAMSLFSMVLQALVTNAPIVISNLASLISNLCQFVIDNAPAMLDGAMLLFATIMQAIIDNAPQILTSLLVMLASLVAAVIDRAPQMLAGAVDFFFKIVEGLGSVDIMGALQAVIDSIFGMFANAGSWLWDAGASILRGLWDGISSGLDWLGGQLAGIGDFIVSHKGPPEYDSVMLEDNGSRIMGGLVDGIMGGVPKLGRALESVNGILSGVIDGNIGVRFGARPAFAVQGEAASASGTVNNYYTIHGVTFDASGIKDAKTLDDLMEKLVDLIDDARDADPNKW